MALAAVGKRFAGWEGVRTRLKRTLTFARSALAGGAATVTDLIVLAVLVGVFEASPRLANVPALVAGAAVQFVGNRHFAFRASSGSVRQQLAWFALTELVTLTLNGVLYDLVASRVALTAATALLLRLALSSLVFVSWSYPVWRRVFRATAPTSDALRADL